MIYNHGHVDTQTSESANPSYLDTFVVCSFKTQKPGRLFQSESAAPGIITTKISLWSFYDPAGLKQPLVSAARSFSKQTSQVFKLLELS